MSYLAKLKQELQEIEPSRKPFEGFEGGSPMGFSRNQASGLAIFPAEREKVSIYQFYMDPQNPQKGGVGAGEFGETCLPGPPSKPSKGFEDTPEDWRRRFYMLSSVEAPCPGFRLSMDWRQTYDGAHAFLEQHAEAAHALGWGTLDLFAVHRTVGGTRVDCVGAALLAAGSHISAVEPDLIRYARLQDGSPSGRFFRKPATLEMVPVWEFGR